MSLPSAIGSDQTRQGLYRGVFKRALDVSLVLLAGPIVLVVVGVLSAIVACSGGKPFYRQQRVGRNGRFFIMWKLRTMRHDADAVLESYLETDPEARAEWDSAQKLKSDPRITRFGRLLRKTSLDELPQLWNVFAGDMSLVGPRPMMPCQQEIYPGRDYYDLRPGITGIWQVSERNDTSFSDRARFDTLYSKKLSLRTDVSLLAATVRVVLRGTGY